MVWFDNNDSLLNFRAELTVASSIGDMISMAWIKSRRIGIAPHTSEKTNIQRLCRNIYPKLLNSFAISELSTQAKQVAAEILKSIESETRGFK